MRFAFLIFNLLFFFFLAAPFSATGQEILAPVEYNPFLKKQPVKPKLKTTALSLPFFEDFTGYSVFPDPLRWTDHSVYINNTMGINPISRGIATFDALNEKGGPYDSVNNLALIYADSLTSQPIDLSSYSPSDSVYLSFFYQPQGRGFAPEPQDSLILFFKKANNSWTKIWAKEGSTVHPFRQIMIPVSNPDFFHAGFQFRFVNKASINRNDDIWNLDYIRLDAGRGLFDTTINDLAITENPANLLNDYTAMPYRQFMADKNKESAAQLSFFVRNNSGFSRSFDYAYAVRESVSNTPVFTGPSGNAPAGAYGNIQVQVPSYSVNYNAPGLYSKVVLEHRYFIDPADPSDPKGNDTIVFAQIFDNYLSYDDGTAEKSYSLHQGNTLPAKTAVEFHLNQPDTLRGVAVYFGRQVPMVLNQFFSIEVYDDLGLNNGSENVLATQDLLFPGYVDTVNHFWVYKMDNPVPLPKGTFYLGTTQPTQSGGEPLYLGLDVNRTGANYLYINTNGFWEPSIASGALMIRPLLGQPVIATGIQDISRNDAPEWSVFPNPATDKIYLKYKAGAFFHTLIFDMQGRELLRKPCFQNEEEIDISGLAQGVYLIRISEGGKLSSPRKIIKK